MGAEARLTSFDHAPPLVGSAMISACEIQIPAPVLPPPDGAVPPDESAGVGVGAGVGVTVGATGLADADGVGLCFVDEFGVAVGVALGV